MSLDDVQTCESDDDTDLATAAPAPPRRWRRILVGVVVAAVISVTTALGYTLYQQSELHRLQDQAIGTTHDYLVAMAAFDYQHMDANKAAITAGSTEQFAKRYDEMVGALRDIVVTSKGVATATAGHVAVEHLDERSATVVGFVDQHVTNVTAPQGNDQRYRMVVTLVRSGDRWVVDNVETV